MAENAVRCCLALHVSETKLPTFVRLNGGVKSFMDRWKTLDDVLDVANASVVCFEHPTEPLFPRQDMYFSFFADIISAIEFDDDVIGTMVRSDVFLFKSKQQEYTMCRRFNGRKIMWVMTRTEIQTRVMQEVQTEPSGKTVDPAYGSECGGSHARPSGR